MGLDSDRAAMRLKGKTALISGAGRNNGKAIALAFARAGADLILVARELGETLNEVARECEEMGVHALPLLAGVGNHEEVNRVVRLGLERFGKVTCWRAWPAYGRTSSCGTGDRILCAGGRYM